MSDTILFTPASTAQTPDRAMMAGMGLSSFAALLLELALTRLFSVVLFYHFAFLAISLALLGLGAGGVFAHLGKGWLARFETRSLVSRLCSLNALIVPAVLAIVLRIPVSLEISRANFLRLTAIYLASALPFLVTGLEFSVVFARQTKHVSPLYAADLAGGALACLAIVPLLNWLGGPNTILFTGACMGIAGIVWAIDRKGRRAAAARVLFVLVLIAVNYSGRFFDIVYAKGGFRDAAWVEFARWNAISRVEVDRQGDAKAIVIDADASTYLMNVDPTKNWKGTVWEAHLMSAPPAVANVLRPHGDYAIIGPGGGVDVVRAVASGSPSVTGIEINPIIANTIMRGRYADYVYHLYERPEVHIHVTDGRSFVRTAGQQFDVVQMTLVDTWASTAAGAFALSENSLYTVEAFREYFEHLKPDGLIAITRWEFQQPREALRVVSVAMQALHELGVADTRGNFIVVSEGDLDEDGIPVAVLAKRTPFTPEEIARVRAHVDASPKLFVLYPPPHTDSASVTGEDVYSTDSDSFARLIQLNDPQRFAAHYPYDVSPVTDNAPFFFFNLKLGQVFRPGSLQQGMDWKVNLGVAVLGMVLAISLLAVLGFLVVPLAMAARGQIRPVRLLYFVAVGLGYILVEIAFIQRFVLFLGHPVYALTVVVFLLLLSSGAGSLVCRWWLTEIRRIWLPLILIAVALSLYVVILPGLLNRLVGLPFAAKLLVSAALLIPLGFAMGMPFPTGLRALAVKPAGEFSEAVENGTGGNEGVSNLVEWAWAMNAASSVLGSVLAIIIAIQFGLNATLASGAAAYLLALALAKTLRPALSR